VGSGDGWTRCELGHRHWGLFGAAGVLVVRDSEVLLQLRSHHTHNGNTWSVPGGARDADESARDAALREAREETGLLAVDVEPVAEVVDDHGGWSYTTVVARLLRPVVLRHNFESAGVRWVAIELVTTLPLHPGFAASWPVVARAVAELGPGAVT
jgi:8-oxo-dGTP diphosphatase